MLRIVVFDHGRPLGPDALSLLTSFVIASALLAGLAADAPHAADVDFQESGTSQQTKGHNFYFNLLGDMRMERPNEVWYADNTYLPMRHGSLYVIAIRDRFTRQVLSWRVSNTFESDFCVDALNEVLHRFGWPEVINTSQGSLFASMAIPEA